MIFGIDVRLGILCIVLSIIGLSLLISFKYGHLNMIWKHPVKGNNLRIAIAVTIGGILNRLVTIYAPESTQVSIFHIALFVCISMIAYHIINFFNRKDKWK